MSASRPDRDRTRRRKRARPGPRPRQAPLAAGGEGTGLLAGGGRQTRAYLMAMLAANGLSPRRQLGQNFLIDLNLLGLLVEAAGIGERDVVLEVGAGTGGLTTRLAERAGHVVSVEIDPGFFQLASKETRDKTNVTLIAGDALENKNTLRPEVLAAITDAMARLGRDHFHLVANLPYDVAALIIANLLLGETPVRSLTFTVQLEMAERIASPPGHRDYGPLSVLAQTVGHVSWIRTLPPSVFWPRPQVHSAILRIDVAEARRARLDELRKVHRFTRDLFVHRRKTLRSAIASIPGYKRLKPGLDELLEGNGLAGDARAEQLEPEQFAKLYHALAALLKAPEAAP